MMMYQWFAPYPSPLLSPSHAKTNHKGGAGEEGKSWRLLITVQPGARKTQLVGEHGGRLKISLQAPPVEGKANAALLKFIADSMGIRPRQINLVSGQLSRAKDLILEEVSREQIVAWYANNCSDAQ